MLHQDLARSFRESKVKLVVEDAWPFRESTSGQNGRLNPLRMNITTEAGGHSSTTTLDARIRRFYSIVNPCTSSNLEDEARYAGKLLADAVELKKNKYRGLFPATYSLLLLAMSMCREVDSDVHALIKELAIVR